MGQIFRNMPIKDDPSFVSVHKVCATRAVPQETQAFPGSHTIRGAAIGGTFF